MKKIYFLSLIALTIVFSANCAKAQSTYTKQIIIVNGGDFGNPDDYVTVASYDPETEETTEFVKIFTQSVQNVIIHENFAYVSAQDSIVKINIDTFEKETAVLAKGVNQLAISDDLLVVSFWYPANQNFVKTYSLSDLSLISNIKEISGDAAGIIIDDGIALVAIPGPYGSTTGKIASIDIEEGMLLSEDDYGEFYAGIGYFAKWNDVTTAFMKTPWGETNSKAATFDEEGTVIDEFDYSDASLANSTGQQQNNFYAEINNGIGLFDLETNELVNPSVVEQQDNTIAASVFDTINGLFYITTTDFFSTGKGIIYNLDGEKTGGFDAGISAQAIAVDYRTNTGIYENNSMETLSIYPNPASNFINFNIPPDKEIISTIITDVSGRIVYNGKNNKQIETSLLKTGLYFVALKTNTSVFTGRFIKK